MALPPRRDGKAAIKNDKNLPMKQVLIILSLLAALPVSGQQRKTKHLIVVTTDGYRWKEIFRGADSAKLFARRWFGMDSALKIQSYWAPDEKERREKLMPFFWNYMAKHGQIYGNRDLGNKVNVTNPFWVSHAGYSEMFTGYPYPEVTNGIGPNPHITLLEFINNQPKYKGKVGVFASWDEYYDIFNMQRSGLPINAGWTPVEEDSLSELQKALNFQQEILPRPFGRTERLDASTYPLAKEYMKRHHPDVFYLAFIDTDARAHHGEYDNYLNAAHHFDAMLADLWEYIQQDPYYKDQTTLFITTDHGRGAGKEWTSHYYTIPHSDEIWFAVMGPDTPPRGEVSTRQQFYQKQFANTMAAFLGIRFTGDEPKGEAIPDVFKKK